jgi:hypothetical protein
VGAPPEVRVPIENEGMMKHYQPALGESLDSIREGESISLYGVASVGNCQGYYLITDRGVHYCDSEKAGLFKKTYVSRFVPRSRMATGVIDQVGPNYAFLRIYDRDDEMVLAMKFDNPWQRAACIEQAEAAAQALAFEGQ